MKGMTALLVTVCTVLVARSDENQAPKASLPDGAKVPVVAKNEKVAKLFESMRKNNFEELEKAGGIPVLTLMNDFPKLDFDDIPALLELADSKTVLRTVPTNPLSSVLLNQCTEGMAALWFVEGVRQGGTKFPSLVPVCFKKNGDKADQGDIAKAYRVWWEKAKSLKPGEAMALDPLAGTNLNNWH